jgi:hypothetical protein
MRAHVDADNVIPLVRGRQSWRFTQSDLSDLRRIFPMGDFVPGADAGTGDAFVMFDADHGDLVLLIARGADGRYRRIDPDAGKTLAHGPRLAEVLSAGYGALRLSAKNFSAAAPIS